MKHLFRHKKLIMIGVGLVSGIAFMSRGLFQEVPDDLGLRNGKLQPCPDSPNCASTEGPNSSQLEPLRYQTSLLEAQTNLRRLLESMPRTRVLAEAPNYLHVAFRVPWTAFVDDVEFRFDDEGKVIHMRSASRIGRWDLGVNRRRLVRIQKLSKEHKSNQTDSHQKL